METYSIMMESYSTGGEMEIKELGLSQDAREKLEKINITSVSEFMELDIGTIWKLCDSNHKIFMDLIKRIEKV